MVLKYAIESAGYHLVSLKGVLEVMNDSCCSHQNRVSLILTAECMGSPQLCSAWSHPCNSEPLYSRVLQGSHLYVVKQILYFFIVHSTQKDLAISQAHLLIMKKKKNLYI